MERAKRLAVTLLGAFSLFIPKLECLPLPNPDQASRRPLCISQLALVNHACTLLPLTPKQGLNPTPPAPPSPDHDDGDHNDSEDYDSDGDNGDSDGGNQHSHGGHQHNHGGHQHRHRHRHNHNHRHRHRHNHNHNHNHRHRHREIVSPAMEDCCRWLKEVDKECVCDLLVRLPPFLVRPGHVYTVNIEDACSVTYQCDGRIAN